MIKISKKIAIIFILLVLILYMVISVIPTITGALNSTQVIEYGQLQLFNEEDCFIVRNEVVSAVKSGGTLKYLTEEGNQVKRGSRILEVTPSKETKLETQDKKVKTPYEDILKRLGDKIVVDDSGVSSIKGIVSYHVDGFESFFEPGNIHQLTYAKVKGLNIKPESLKRNESGSGEPVFKICDNSNWYIVFWVDEPNISKYQKGQRVSVEMPGGKVSATVDYIREDDKKWLISLKTNRYYKNFVRERQVRAKVLTTDAYGLLVDNSAITTNKSKEIGVYVKDAAGDFHFKRVNTLVSDGKKTLVSEGTFMGSDGKIVNTVKIYDQVLKRPKVVSGN